jgi:hypothetical protein
MKKVLCLALFLLVMLPIVLSVDYTLTGRRDFVVYADENPELASYVYTTVNINESAYSGEDFKCITMLFAEQNGSYLHVQSNPPHINPMVGIVGVLNPNSEMSNSPEALGYFPVHNGIANVYYRSQDVIAYNSFLYVILCNSNQTQLVYEEALNPVYKEMGKSLPSRGVWFAQSGNASTFAFVAGFVLVVLTFIFYRFTK